MNRRAELLDAERQTADHNAAQRAEHTAAAEPTPGVFWIGNEPLDVPDARDLAEMETWR